MNGDDRSVLLDTIPIIDSKMLADSVIATYFQIKLLKKEFNENLVAFKRRTREQNEQLKITHEQEKETQENKITAFLKEFNQKGSLLEQEISKLKGTGLACKSDLKNLASIKIIDKLANRLIEYYGKLEETKDTVIKLSSINTKCQNGNRLRLERWEVLAEFFTFIFEWAFVKITILVFNKGNSPIHGKSFEESTITCKTVLKGRIFLVIVVHIEMNNVEHKLMKTKNISTSLSYSN
ncbi:hypothetical protein H8356DRAFT_1335138 [Neocallimastix lanati (nom. inval.)]|nr:hypothetical protein H8356DRAFT_1335138 [Neocallimastix sp. JGI-2020a]